VGIPRVWWFGNGPLPLAPPLRGEGEPEAPRRFTPPGESGNLPLGGEGGRRPGGVRSQPPLPPVYAPLVYNGAGMSDALSIQGKDEWLYGAPVSSRGSSFRAPGDAANRRPGRAARRGDCGGRGDRPCPSLDCGCRSEKPQTAHSSSTSRRPLGSSMRSMTRSPSTLASGWSCASENTARRRSGRSWTDGTASSIASRAAAAHARAEGGSQPLGR
jgi:hypothetical protein